MKNEMWRTFYTSKFGYEYAISNYGRLKNVTKDKILKPNVSRHTNRVYAWAQFRKDGKVFNLSRLVAENFVPNPDNKPWVDHINHNSLDNRATNLRWVTPLENQRNTVKVEDILKRMSEFFSIAQIATFTGLTTQQIGMYLYKGDTSTVRERYAEWYDTLGGYYEC